MTSLDFLIFSLALMPALLAAHVWWYVTHAGDELSADRAVDSNRFEN